MLQENFNADMWLIMVYEAIQKSSILNIQHTFVCSKSTIETQEKVIKYVQG